MDYANEAHWRDMEGYVHDRAVLVNIVGNVLIIHIIIPRTICRTVPDGCRPLDQADHLEP